MSGVFLLLHYTVLCLGMVYGTFHQYEEYEIGLCFAISSFADCRYKYLVDCNTVGPSKHMTI